jgi:dihydroxy-acid dehydratase
VTGKDPRGKPVDAAPLKNGQQIIQPIEAPILPRGHIRILSGNLAPTGAVAKITGKEGERFEGTRKVYDSEEAMLAGLEKGEIVRGRCRHPVRGPKGGPACRKCCTPPRPSWARARRRRGAAD